MGRRKGEGLAGHEGGAVLRAVAREHSPPGERVSEGCDQRGAGVEEQSCDGLEVEEKEEEE